MPEAVAVAVAVSDVVLDTDAVAVPDTVLDADTVSDAV